MLVCKKGINKKTGDAQLCNKCHDNLCMNKLPPLSLNNLIWIGDIPEDLQSLTIAEQKLIALVNTFHLQKCHLNKFVLYSIDILAALLNCLVLQEIQH